MKNYLLTLIIVFSLIFNSGSSYKTNNSSRNISNIENTFVFINTHLVLKKNKQECKENCYQLFDLKKEIIKINKILIEITPLVVGSGFIYDNKSSTKIITANHLCEKVDKYLKYNKEFNSSRLDLLSALGSSRNIDPLIMIQISNEYSFTPAVTLFDFHGNKYSYEKIIKQDKNKDLCVIESKESFGQSVEFNEKNCIYGEEVINISAADGFYIPKAVPYYKGVYSGHVNNERFKVYNKGAEVSLYSIDISEGSSGSGVFSSKTKKLCGNINASIRKSKLSIGSSSSSIKNFIYN